MDTIKGITAVKKALKKYHGISSKEADKHIAELQQNEIDRSEMLLQKRNRIHDASKTIVSTGEDHES